MMASSILPAIGKETAAKWPTITAGTAAVTTTGISIAITTAGKVECSLGQTTKCERLPHASVVTARLEIHESGFRFRRCWPPACDTAGQHLVHLAWKAYQGETLSLPLIGGVALRQSEKSCPHLH